MMHAGVSTKLTRLPLRVWRPPNDCSLRICLVAVLLNSPWLCLVFLLLTLVQRSDDGEGGDVLLVFFVLWVQKKRRASRRLLCISFGGCYLSCFSELGWLLCEVVRIM